MARLFLALEISEQARQVLRDYVERLRPLVAGVRYMPPQSWHVTLKFLGETAKREEIERALETLQLPEVEFTAAGTGFFPGEHRPRVFWAGIAGEMLEPVAQAVDAAMMPLGFAAEKQPYHPHLTLAREGSGSPRPQPGERTSPRLLELARRLPSQKAFDSVTMTAREFVLFESRLTPGGAIYTPLRRFRLQRCCQP
jgi:2'-5' RNA ligase